MKKMFLKTALVSLLAISAQAQAATGGYYSTLHPQAASLAVSTLVPATDITVVNASPGVIYDEVPNAIYDAVTPGINDHIRHPTFTGNTFINLRANDLNRTIFWSGYVCRYAILTVYGITAANVGVDNEYCN